MRASVTISDVAQAAGVSRATVSRVMNGSKVDADLTRRVRDAAQRLNYRPSLTARSLSLGRTLAVGIVVPDLANPMFQTVLRAVADGAYRSGYGVVVAETAGRGEREIDIVRATRARCDALVLVSPGTPDEQLAEVVAEVHPVVMVNRSLPNSHVPAVSVDYSEAMYRLVEHLFTLGHRRIVYLSGPESTPSNIARLDGLGRARVAFPDVTFATLAGGSIIASGWELAHAVLATGASAVIGYNDLVAFGLVAHFNELGVAVPDTISVVGFDGIDLATYTTPSLTTVRVPYQEIGLRAWERLRARIDAGPGATLEGPRVEYLPTELEVRTSTGPAA